MSQRLNDRDKDNRALRTGEIAKICRVGVKQVHTWIDNEHLKGFVVPGKGGHRRVLESELKLFCQAYNIPYDNTMLA